MILNSLDLFKVCPRPPIYKIKIGEMVVKLKWIKLRENPQVSTLIWAYPIFSMWDTLWSIQPLHTHYQSTTPWIVIGPNLTLIQLLLTIGLESNKMTPSKTIKTWGPKIKGIRWSNGFDILYICRPYLDLLIPHLPHDWHGPGWAPQALLTDGAQRRVTL